MQIKEKVLKEEFKACKTYFWSYPKPFPKFIRYENNCFPTYVIYHINEIGSSANVLEWQFVPGKRKITDKCALPKSKRRSKRRKKRGKKKIKSKRIK